MKPVNNLFGLFTLLLLIVFNGQARAQKKNQLYEEQKKIEERIKSTKNLLSKTEKDLKNRTIQLQLTEKNLSLRERLVRNIDQQIRSTEQRITDLEASIDQLDKQTKVLKDQYREMIVYAYKNRGSLSKLMFVFSSENFNQASKRSQYLEKIKEVRTRQVQLIRTNQDRMNLERQELSTQKKSAQALIAQKKIEREALLAERIQQQELFNQVKKEENTLRDKLIADEKQKARIQKEIQKAIEKELAEARRKQQEQERLRQQKEAEQNKNKQNNTVPPKQQSFDQTPELTLQGNNFAANKGRLPYPVPMGSIIEKFGRNAHPTIANVYTDNNGVNISSNRGAEVRAVYEGEVSSVISIPGAGKAIILSHGNYRTVYANLQDVYVSKGTKITHKQLLGSLLPEGNISVLHFEIHVIKNNDVQKLNPELWLSK